jgi:hypothetical protein
LTLLVRSLDDLPAAVQSVFAGGARQ